MKLIVGLGNVGNKYSQTRHNLGFMIIDQLANDNDLPELAVQKKFNAQITQGNIGKISVLLAKPTTMMNLSGDSVSAIANFYRIKTKDIWVIHDDLDVAYGSLRIRTGGGAGGHNGVASIIETVSDGFTRFRVGIGSNRDSGLPSEAYVLSAFSPDEAEDLPKIIRRTAESITHHITDSDVFDHTRNLLH